MKNLILFLILLPILASGQTFENKFVILEIEGAYPKPEKVNEIWKEPEGYKTIQVNGARYCIPAVPGEIREGSIPIHGTKKKCSYIAFFSEGCQGCEGILIEKLPWSIQKQFISGMKEVDILRLMADLSSKSAMILELWIYDEKL